MKWELPPRGGHMDSANSIYLQNMKGFEVEERLKVNDIIIVPLGSTEAHGPHACSGEDTFLVTRMAELVAQRTGCTVSPALLVRLSSLSPSGYARNHSHSRGDFHRDDQSNYGRLMEHGLQEDDTPKWAWSGVCDSNGNSPVCQDIPGTWHVY